MRIFRLYSSPQPVLQSYRTGLEKYRAPPASESEHSHWYQVKIREKLHCFQQMKLPKLIGMLLYLYSVVTSELSKMSVATQVPKSKTMNLISYPFADDSISGEQG